MLKKDKKNKKSDEQKANSVSGQLLQAGRNGNINRRELMQISESTGESTGQIIEQLDKLNAKKKLSIGIGNAAVKGFMKDPLSWSGFGGGKIGSAISDYWRASNARLGGIDKSGSYSNWSGYSEVTPGMKQSRAGLIPLQGGAYQIDAKGKYSPKTANKLFMANYVNKIIGATTDPATDPATAATAPATATQQPGSPAEDTIEDPSMGGGGAFGGGEGYGGASYLKAARSRWKKLGISSRGANALSRGLNYSNMFGR